MYTKTITPESTSVTIELPESFVGKHVRVTVYVEKEDEPRKAPTLEDIERRYSRFPRIDMSKFKFDRNEANDFD